ncbi:MocR-like pyridoxine biosynthesis transcription factor PdxR [Flavobacteriaceae bacterium 14752]|uniref:MocR-like pyridoxine biosynthesis transcription factor PdxR n=1 Tax=Mesohalobacter salilacus TaxID=2491711 RepID=UPI000F62C632|nr:PLP-dependent aminotransferase family protein [Flavobacteriaceae bacterium 14752]
MHTSKDIILDLLKQSYIHLQTNQKPPTYLKILNLVKQKIDEHQIPKEVFLPSTRQLSRALGVSRSTIVRVYNLLAIEGYVKSIQGAGYLVNPIDLSPVKKKNVSENSNYPVISDRGKMFIKNVSLMHSTAQKDLAFRPGLPPLDVFPVNQWKRLFNSYWKQVKFSNLSFSDSSGLDHLKKNVALYLNLVRGIRCDHEQIVIVSGSLQSLYLIANAVLNPMDKVIMESPTFPNVHSIFKSLGADISALPLDQEGLQIKSFKGKPPKLIHTTPSSHYPTGKQMTLNRKKELLDWAQQHKAIIIENDYDHEISNWKRENNDAIFSLDNSQRTVYLGTFNRLLHQSIRLGYMVVPYYLLDVIKALQMHSHRFVSPSNQIVMSQFIENNYIYSHIKNVVKVAKERKSLFVEQFQDLMPSSFKIQDSEARSLHILVKIPEHINDKTLKSDLFKSHINVHNYSHCFLENSQNGLIFGYSAVKKPIMTKKIKIMQNLVKKHL